MKKYSSVLLALALSGTAAMAQETSTPQVEVGLNYSWNRINPGGGLSAYNANGGFADVQYNLTRTFGIVADLGGNYTGTANHIGVNNTTFEYLFGPRVNLRHGRFNPFVQALFGQERFTNGLAPATAAGYTGATQNNFAMALGGGIDYTINHMLAVRPVEVDYMPAQIGQANLHYTQNDFRYAAGIVLRFGSK